MNRFPHERKPKLLDQVQAAIRTRHYSLRTEEAYVGWIRRFVLYYARGEILVREGKGQKDRVTMLPSVVREPLVEHLERVRKVHDQDVKEGFGRVYMPDALEEIGAC